MIMLIKEKSGNIILHRLMITVILMRCSIEWYEARKRILHKETKSGRQLRIKFLNENPDLKDGDILWQDENSIIAVEIIPCECIVMTPSNMREPLLFAMKSATGICHFFMKEMNYWFHTMFLFTIY